LARRGLAVSSGTFVEGQRCTWAPPALTKLGGLLARLHAVEQPLTSPASWYHPLLESVEEARFRLAAYPELTAALERSELVEQCPVSLIHADVWSGNVIEDTYGDVTLIDWEHSGIGHSVLDLADAMVDCVSDDAVKALIAGYLGFRSLKSVERDALVPAAQITIAIRVARKLGANRLESIPREIARFERSQSLRP
jgi:thiamine kinase-like enzyme